MPITYSLKETQLYAKKLAEKLSQKNLNPQPSTLTPHPSTLNPIIIGLIGELGSGKTTFIQGFARALGIKRRLLSPTFLIIRSYKIPKNTKNSLLITHYSLLTHIDVYRLHRPKEILDLGFKKIITNPQNIVLIEWAEKIKALLPKNTLWLKFEHGKKENERIIKYN